MIAKELDENLRKGYIPKNKKFSLVKGIAIYFACWSLQGEEEEYYEEKKFTKLDLIPVIVKLQISGKIYEEDFDDISDIEMVSLRRLNTKYIMSAYQVICKGNEYKSMSRSKLRRFYFK